MDAVEANMIKRCTDLGSLKQAGNYFEEVYVALVLPLLRYLPLLAEQKNKAAKSAL